MPIVVRNGMQYQLEGPNDVPSSGNLIGSVPGIPPVGGFGQGGPFASTGTRRVDLPGGGYTFVPQSMYGDPSLYENSFSKTVSAPGPRPDHMLNFSPGGTIVPSSRLEPLSRYVESNPEMFQDYGIRGSRDAFADFPELAATHAAAPYSPRPMVAPNLGSWTPPTPEYLTAPGYATYAPTAAYAYSPTGGDWSGAYPGYGGGGGGGLPSGDFGGGTDTGMLGGLLSAASVLGGANNLSSFLTGKSLLDHADIPNPFSNLLGGGEGLSFTDYLPNAIKDALNIYPSQGGLLTPGGGTALLTPLQGEAMVNALGGTGPGTLSSQFTEAMNAAGGPWPQAAPAVAPPPAAPVSPASLNLNVPDVFNLATGQYPSNAYLAPAFEGGMTNAQGAAFADAIGGSTGTGTGTLSSNFLAAMPTQGFGAFAAAPGANVYGALGGVAPPLGGAGASTATGMGALAGPLAIAGLASMFKARFDAQKDPTADTRTANELENYFQRALQSPEQKRLELENLKQAVYTNPGIMSVMKHAARTADPNLQHTSGGTETVGWKGNVPAMFEELLPELERVAAESTAANYGGQYNIGDEGLRGAPLNPYGENTRMLDQETGGWQARPPVIDYGAIELGYADDPRLNKVIEPIQALDP